MLLFVRLNGGLLVGYQNLTWPAPTVKLVCFVIGCKRDQVDLGPFIQWHKTRPSFSGRRYGGDLFSLSTGITDDSKVYCHNTEEVDLWF